MSAFDVKVWHDIQRLYQQSTLFNELNSKERQQMASTFYKHIKSKQNWKELLSKMRKVQNSHSAPHAGAHFCLAQRKQVDTIAAMNSDDTIYISLDNKARAPIGIPLAKKQGKLLGLKEVRVADHDFPYGASHSYIVSVYRLCIVSNKGHVDERNSLYITDRKPVDTNEEPSSSDDDEPLIPTGNPNMKKKKMKKKRKRGKTMNSNAKKKKRRLK